MSKRIRRYVRQNYGSPFVVGFMILLILSAFLLTVGNPLEADTLAVYAFYLLVMGVVLQIVSYLKHGEETVKVEPSTPVTNTGWRISQRSARVLKILAVALAASLVTGSAVYYLGVTAPTSPGLAKSSTTAGPLSTRSQLSATVAAISAWADINGSVRISIDVTASGGVTPYSFQMVWGDQFIQTSANGTFARHLDVNQTIPKNATVSVHSSDEQNASVVVVVPPPRIRALTVALRVLSNGSALAGVKIMIRAVEFNNHAKPPAFLKIRPILLPQNISGIADSQGIFSFNVTRDIGGVLMGYYYNETSGSTQCCKPSSFHDAYEVTITLPSGAVKTYRYLDPLNQRTWDTDVARI